MKKNILILSVFVALLFTACQKEISWNNVSSIGVNNDDYQPVSAGSEWNYTSTYLGNSTMKAFGTDTMISGKRYYEFDRITTAGTARAYQGKENKVYYQYGDLGPATGIVIINLKDSAIGCTWTNTITLSGFSNYHKYTVTGRDLTRIVNGKNYNNVIELTYEMLYDDPLGGGISSAGGGKNYYAKGVGPIEAFYTVGFFGVTQSDTTRLVSYTIR